MAIKKTEYLKFGENLYEVIPPFASEEDRGGIIASPKTENETIEVKLGDDGKLYVPETDLTDYYNKAENDDFLSKKAEKEHNHEINHINGLQDALDNKSDNDHNHDDKYDALGSANSALSSANEYTDTQLEDLSGRVAYINATSNENVIDPETGTVTNITVDSALSSTSTNPVQNKVIKAELDKKANTSYIPTKTSQLTNDSGFITANDIPEIQVPDASLTQSGVSADAKVVGDRFGEIEGQISDKEASGTAQARVTEHNTSETSHSDIRLLIEGLATRLNALADSDDTTLDQMSEIVAYIKSNKSLIDSITTGKVSVSDIIDNLTTSVSNKPLSAKQGVQLKALIDAIVVPTKTSQLTNDSNFVTKEVTDNLQGQIVDLAVTPQMYGAKGDGVTDDTQAFKNALAENDNVFVPKGNYLITDTLDISYKKSLYSDDGQRATIHYNGSNSIINIGRISMFRNINITIKNAFNGIIFDTNNSGNTTNANACSSRVEHSNILFEVASPNADLIGITADSGTDPNNIPTKSGICFQTYRDIHLETSSKGYGHGIKMELIQGREFTEENKTGFPWITHIVFDDIYLGQPHTAIKATATNTSGAELFNRVNMGHILFNNVYTQFRTGETEIFLDLDHFSGYFTKCIGWDYHYLTNEGKKVNIIGDGVTACFSDCDMNFGKEFLQTCDFTAETEYNVTDNPEYFINKYFSGTVLSDGYDYIDAKIDTKLTGEYVSNIAEEKVNEILYSGYSNVLDDPLTQIKVGYRFSNSSQSWSENSEMTTVIIPLVTGGNIIRWLPSDYILSDDYMSVFFFNDDELTTGILIDESPNLWVSDGVNGYLKIDNPSGYKYASIPFKYTDSISSETMTITINREITGDGGKSYTEYLRESVITPAVEEEVKEYAQPKGNYLTEHQDLSDYAKLTDIPSVPTKTSQLQNDSGFITAEDIPESQVPDLSGYALKSNAETWTFTLTDGSTVTKKVVLA